MYALFFFFSSRRRHTRLQGDWSSDVCSSDLFRHVGAQHAAPLHPSWEPLAAGTGFLQPALQELGRQPLEPARQERSEEHTSELQSPCNLVCRLLLEKKKKKNKNDQDSYERVL